MRLIRRSISAGRGAPQMPRTRGPRQRGVGRSVIAGSAPRARTARFFCFASAVCYISQPRRGLPLSAFIFGRLLRSGPSPRGLGNARAVSYALFFFSPRAELIVLRSRRSVLFTRRVRASSLRTAHLGPGAARKSESRPRVTAAARPRGSGSGCFCDVRHARGPPA